MQTDFLLTHDGMEMEEYSGNLAAWWRENFRRRDDWVLMAGVWLELQAGSVGDVAWNGGDLAAGEVREACATGQGVGRLG